MQEKEKENLEVELTDEQQKKCDFVYWSFFILTITILTLCTYSVCAQGITPSYITFNINPAKIEYDDSEMTIEAYAKKNKYNKVNATFYIDKINIEGVDRNYTSINGNPLSAYWEYHKYTPINSEVKEVYYNGTEILTIYKFNQRMEQDTWEKMDYIFYLVLLFVVALFLAFCLSVVLANDLYFMLKRRYLRLNQLRI